MGKKDYVSQFQTAAKQNDQLPDNFYYDQLLQVSVNFLLIIKNTVVSSA